MVRAVVSKHICKVDILPLSHLIYHSARYGRNSLCHHNCRGFRRSTTECAAKVSTRLMGAEANVVLSDTVGVVALREGSTGNTMWTSEILEGVPVMKHDMV